MIDDATGTPCSKTLMFCGPTNQSQSAVCRTVNRTYPISAFYSSANASLSDTSSPPARASRMTRPPPVTTLKTAWRKVRDNAQGGRTVARKRHTVVTELAESGAGDEVIMSIADRTTKPARVGASRNSGPVRITHFFTSPQHLYLSESRQPLTKAILSKVRATPSTSAECRRLRSQHSFITCSIYAGSSGFSSVVNGTSAVERRTPRTYCGRELGEGTRKRTETRILARFRRLKAVVLPIPMHAPKC
jgi:hypothetical protein